MHLSSTSEISLIMGAQQMSYQLYNAYTGYAFIL